MAILSNLVPCNGDRLIIYGGVHPIVGDLGRGSAMSGMGGVGMGKRVVEEMIFSTATGPNSVATLTEASSMVGASASWRIEGSGGTLCRSGENSTWSVAVSLVLYVALWWLEADRKGGP
eukprot:scaffold67337_cov76-Attheya_sp.AAC.1